MDLGNRESYHRSAGVKTTDKQILTVKKSIFFYKNLKKKINRCTFAWVTQPERPKGVKDIIKEARRAAT